VTLRARWVKLRARWVKLRARWVKLRARWVKLISGGGAGAGRQNHTADVTDVAWDARGEMLATASIDNTAAVWAVPPDAGLAGFGGGMSRPWQMLASLTQHTGYVKGVAFDPVGKFLATQSDDRSVILWHTEDWTPVKQVEPRSPLPFKHPVESALNCKAPLKPYRIAIESVLNCIFAGEGVL
jgi:WD40 repeat protein